MELVFIIGLILIVAAPIMALVALYRQRDYRQHADRIHELEVRVEYLRKKLDVRTVDGARLQELEIRVDELRKEPEARSTGMSGTGISSAGGPGVEPPVEGPLGEETEADPIAASSAHEPEESTATREPEGLSWAGAPLPEEELPTEADAESEPSAAPAGLYPRSGLRPRTSEYASKTAVSFQRIDWEQWVGVRGAAVVGGISLVLAGLFFLQYAITHGWFGPGLRVVTAVVVGIACILVRPTLHERGHTTLAGVLTGAGVVLLYGAAWASCRLYDFIGFPVAFTWMAMVTVLTGWLSVRHNSQSIAVFGLAGGFATPLLLTSGDMNPLGLFGYILLLDLGLMFVGHRRSWPKLRTLGLAGTLLYQGFWIMDGVSGGQGWLALSVLAVFAGVFTLSSAREPDQGGTEVGDRGGLDVVRLGSLLVPFAFALQLGLHSDFAGRLWPFGLLMCLLAGMAVWVGKTVESRNLKMGVGVAALGLTLALGGRLEMDLVAQWEIVLVAVGVALVLCMEKLLPGMETPDAGHLLPASGFSTAGFLVVLTAIVVRTGPMAELLPFATGAALLMTLGLTVNLKDIRQDQSPVFGALAGLLVGSLAFQEARDAWPEGAIGLHYAAVAGGLSGILLLFRTRVRDEAKRGALAICVVLMVAPIILSFGMVIVPREGQDAQGVNLVVLLLTVIGVVGSTLARSAWGHGLLTFSAIFAMTRWAQSLELIEPGYSLACQALTLLILTAGPLFRRRAGLLDRWMMLAGACASPLWIIALNHERFDTGFEADSVPLQFVALAAMCALGALVRSIPHSAAALSLAVFALSRWLGVEWIAVGVALTGFVWAWFARRTPGVAMTNAAGVASVLSGLIVIALGVEPGHFVRSDSLLWNPVSGTFAAAAAALIAASARYVSVRAIRPEDENIAHLVKLTGLLAILVIFTGLNLLVLNAYSSEEVVRFSWSRQPQRDLVMSLVWVLYSVVLLVTGAVSYVDALRKVGLAFMLFTIGKVFLYDLGELRGLYRVGSILGLALSLIGVSLFYQRFIKPRSESESSEVSVS